MDKIIDKKLIKFISVGVLNTFVGTAIMLSLYNFVGCSYWFSSAANYLITSILSYVLNKRFTFGYSGGTCGSAVKFAVNIAVCYVAAYSIAKPAAALLLSGSSVAFRENVAMLTGMCIFTGLNYLGQRFFVFGSGNRESKANYETSYKQWLKSPHLSDDDRKTLAGLTEEEQFDRFCKTVEFGTAGMRGKMGLGTNRLNMYTIRLAAKGVAGFLGEGSKVAIAYDTRNNSKLFAEESARVLAAAGIEAYIFNGYSPVPLLSFAVRELSCDGGIAITASHNAKEYNGFKVYDQMGCQLDSKATAAIAEYMEAIPEKLNIPASSMDSAKIKYIGKEMTERFLDEAVKCSIGAKKSHGEELSVIYTPLHGSGRDFVAELLKRAGFKNVKLVEEQSDYNGEFPTVKKPDPESPKTLSLAGKHLISEKGDILIGTDPDCDRIGVGARRGSGIVFFTGNQMGALLVEYLSETRDVSGKTVINTIVTGMLGDMVAEAHGINVIKTLNGFKNVGRAMEQTEENDFLMAYEDSCGYLVRPYIRDKDAVSAALVICEMAAYYKAKGKTLADVLDELYEKYGHIVEKQESFVFEGEHGRLKMENIMNTIRLKGKEAFTPDIRIKEFVDYGTGVGDLPSANILKYIFSDDSWVIIRPSGTEPKMKIYYGIKDNNHELFTKLSQAIQGFC